LLGTTTRGHLLILDAVDEPLVARVRIEDVKATRQHGNLGDAIDVVTNRACLNWQVKSLVNDLAKINDESVDDSVCSAPCRGAGNSRLNGKKDAVPTCLSADRSGL
jgi:hypothetical protein